MSTPKWPRDHHDKHVAAAKKGWEGRRLMHRPTKRNRSVVGHRKDLQAAHRRMYEAYERAKTPAARRKIMARIRAIEREMERRDGYE